MTGTVDAEAGGRPTAGAKLRAAREAAGLSVDAVAQQLKLAPRQVKALEDDDWQRLPGRTFVRGFARNYARFVRLDPEAVLALLPAPETTPALERPALAASPRAMGEIPVERVARPSALRWLIPLLVIVVIAFGGYEFMRAPAQFLARFDIPGLRSEPPAAPAVPVAATPLSDAPAAAGASAATDGATTPLPRPAGAAPAGPTASTTSSSEISATTSPGDATPAPLPGGASAPTSTSDASVAAPASTPDAKAPARAAAPATEASLVLTFKGTSWVEVKDAHGRVVVQMTGGPGMTQTVSAVPPLELALGNAPQVEVSFRGQVLDLSPYMRGSVARVALK
ncbi:MAG: helix-turn-helix domain-containing protein [Rudaea sp.]